MSEDDVDRTEGVNFESVAPLFEALSYPITSEELVAEHGDLEVERTNAGPITIRELFAPMAEDTFESDEGLRGSILTMMPKDSAGRQRYSDRGLTIDDPNEVERQDRPLPGHDVDGGEERSPRDPP